MRPASGTAVVGRCPPLGSDAHSKAILGRQRRGARVEFAGQVLARPRGNAGQPWSEAGSSAGLLIFHDYAGGDGGALRPVFRGRQAMPLLEGAHEVTSFRNPGQRQDLAERKRRGSH